MHKPGEGFIRSGFRAARAVSLVEWKEQNNQFTPTKTITECAKRSAEAAQTGPVTGQRPPPGLSRPQGPRKSVSNHTQNRQPQ
jgi:hypothetical protein